MSSPPRRSAPCRAAGFDLEDEEFAGKRGRIDVVGEPAAVAHGEAPQFGSAREEARNPSLELRFGEVHFF
jgi:hypothetical protein